MGIKVDGKGQPYVDVEKVRITFKKQIWSGGPGISIRAYRDDGSSLFPGPEIPLDNHKIICELIEAIIALVKEYS